LSDLVPEPDPKQPTVARRDIRVSDADRHVVIDELRVHFSLGRLDLAELEDRVTAALESRTRGDLEPLLTDLPELRPSSSGGPPVREREFKEGSPLRVHTYLWLVLSAFFVLIWLGSSLVSGGVPFWPIFPISAIGLTVGVHAAINKGIGEYN